MTGWKWFVLACDVAELVWIVWSLWMLFRLARQRDEARRNRDHYRLTEECWFKAYVRQNRKLYTRIARLERKLEIRSRRLGEARKEAIAWADATRRMGTGWRCAVDSASKLSCDCVEAQT